MRFLRLKEVQAVVRLSRTTIWRMERAQTFPRRRKLGANSVAWDESEIQDWCQSRQRA